MNRSKTIGVAAALAGAVSLAALAMPSAAIAQQGVKCWGVAESGKNDCASKFSESKHSCAGHSKEAFFGGDFKAVADAKTCADMGGKLEAYNGYNEMKKGMDKKS